MKRYNVLIQDKDEKEWDFFVKNKDETNIDDALIKLVREHNSKKRKNGS